MVQIAKSTESVSNIFKVNKITVAIPCLNTEDSIAKVIADVKQYVDEVVVVDDGSTDLTTFEAEAAGARVIRHTKNLGKGAAMKTAARNSDSDILIFIDGDGQHNPADIPRMWEPLLQKKADYVIGSRYLSGSETFSTPIMRRLSNIAASMVISFAITIMLPIAQAFTFRRNEKSSLAKPPSRGKYLIDSSMSNKKYKVRLGRFKWISDCTSGFTAIYKPNWNKLNITSDRYEIETELIFEHARNGLIIAEVPISCRWGNYVSGISIVKDSLRTLAMLARKFR